MRRLRQWWPVIAAGIFLCIVALGLFVLYAAVTFDRQLFEGTWHRDGEPGASLTVIYEGERCTLRFDDDRSGASQTVPAVSGFVTIDAILPESMDPTLLGGKDIGSGRLPITLTGAATTGRDSLNVMAETGPGSEETVLWTYGPAGFFPRSMGSWEGQLMFACAFLVVAVLLFGSRKEEMRGRDKAARVAVVLAGAAIIVALLTQSNYALLLVRPLVAACWALFLVLVVPPQIPAIGQGLGVIFMPSRRRTFREGLDSQDDQVERGEAMDRVLGEAIADRGDRERVEGGDDDA